MNIRVLRQSEWKEAAALVWETFLLFEAPDYSPEGVETFRRFIEDQQNLHALKIYGAFDGGCSAAWPPFEKAETISPCCSSARNFRAGESAKGCCSASERSCLIAASL